jgi:hypothetical protein
LSVNSIKIQLISSLLYSSCSILRTRWLKGCQSCSKLLLLKISKVQMCKTSIWVKVNLGESLVDFINQPIK